MARRRINLLEQVFEWTARLPWWSGVAAALLSWLAMHALMLAVPDPVSETAAAAPAALQVLMSILRGVAAGLKYLLPAVFLCGAVFSAWLAHRRRKNYADVAGERGHVALELLSWREFENLVGEFFRRKGFHVEQRGGRMPDGGVDVVASIGEDRYLVQCKHWRMQRVGVKVVREICGVAAAEGAAGVFVVTSGAFTEEARRFVDENRIAIELIAGDQLRKMIQGLEIPAPNGRAAG